MNNYIKLQIYLLVKINPGRRYNPLCLFAQLLNFRGKFGDKFIHCADVIAVFFPSG